MKRLLFSLLAVFGLMLAMGSRASADSISFDLNTDETLGSPPAGTTQVTIDRISNTSATVTFTNLDPSDALYNFHNVFFNVSGPSAIGTCTQSVSCSSITGTGAGNGPYYFVSNQSGGFGAMTYNVDDTGTAATSVTIDLTATGSNSWTSAGGVLTPNSSGYDASTELYTQSGYQDAGKFTGVTPEPSSMLLLGSGLLALGLALRRKLPAAA